MEKYQIWYTWSRTPTLASTKISYTWSKYKIGKINLKTLKKFNFFEFLVKNSYNLTINDTILTKFGQWKLIPTYDEEIKKNWQIFQKFWKIWSKIAFFGQNCLKNGIFSSITRPKALYITSFFSLRLYTHTWTSIKKILGSYHVKNWPRTPFFKEKSLKNHIFRFFSPKLSKISACYLNGKESKVSLYLLKQFIHF